MKFFFAIAMMVAVASGYLHKPTVNEWEQIQEVIAAIQSPSVDPTTAAMVLDQLYEALGINPIDVNPAIVDPVQVVDEADNKPSPAIVGPSPAVVAENSSPLVQIIVNVKGPAGAVNPVEVVGPSLPVDPVQVVDEAENLTPIVPDPIILPPAVLPPMVIPEPIIIEEPTFPIAPEPVVLPEELN